MKLLWSEINWNYDMIIESKLSFYFDTFHSGCITYSYQYYFMKQLHVLCYKKGGRRSHTNHHNMTVYRNKELTGSGYEQAQTGMTPTIK